MNQKESGPPPYEGPASRSSSHGTVSRHHIVEQDTGQRPGPEELRAEVYRLVDEVVGDIRARYGAVTNVGSIAWWAAPDDAKLAAVLVTGEAFLVSNPHQIAAEQLKAASMAISTGLDWGKFADRHIAYAELQRRRAEPGPLATTDTTTSREEAVAA